MAKSNSGPNWLIIIIVLLAVGTAVTVFVLSKKDPTKGMTDEELQRYQFSKLSEQQKKTVIDTNRQVLGLLRPF